MVTVVVPWRGGCPHRERAWAWVRKQYELKHPDWHVVEAAAPDGPWCKATAVQPAVEAAPDGVVIVADADVWCEGLERAVFAVASGLANWAVPHLHVRRLAEHAPSELCQDPYIGVKGGGFVVARRSTLIDTPLDPRFEGWGQEDASWGIALHVLHGPAWRGGADLIHLWHPPQERMTRKFGSAEGRALHRRYALARRDPVAMRALIEEARHVSHSAPQYALHDHASGRRHDD